MENNILLRRFKKDLKNFDIYHKLTTINLSPKMLKREPIYSENIIIDSYPFKVKDGKIISSSKKIILYNPNKYALIPYYIFHHIK
jgi:hypothetical protein